MRRCRVKADEKTGRFLKNGQSRKKGLNRSISDAGWADLILGSALKERIEQATIREKCLPLVI